MKSKLFLVALYAFFISNSLSKYSGFEKNIENIANSFNFLENKLLLSYQPVLHYIINIQNYDNNKMLFNNEFLEKLNVFIDNMNTMKHDYYRNIKFALKHIHYIKARELSFDIFLTDGYSDLIQFIANFNVEDMEENLKELFKDFIGQKNMLFFDVRELYMALRNYTINTINLFDTIETFEKYAKLPESEEPGYTLDDLKRYYYVLGFLRKLNTYYSNNKDLQRDIMTVLEHWEESLQNLDESLETIKVYYHRRYVEGIIDAEEGSNEDEDDQEGAGELEDEDSERDPINVCNNIYLKNYNIEGLLKAETIDQFDEIEECPDIKNSCCEREEISRIYNNYFHSILPIISKKYLMLGKLTNFLLDNFNNFRRYGYEIYRNPKSKNDCKAYGKSIMFNPISKDFVNKFAQFTADAHEFSVISRTGIYCSLCDYDFHKSMMENDQIKLSLAFCDTMVKKTFDYTASFHLQLLDYFNDLIQVLQCDIKTGFFKQETDLIFEHNDSIKDILTSCDDNDREKCIEYCNEFYFTSLNSIFDVNFDKVVDLYNFIKNKMRAYGIDTNGKVNEEQLPAIYNEFKVEKNAQTLKHIDTLERIYIQDVTDLTAHNPFTEGPGTEDISEMFKVE